MALPPRCDRSSTIPPPARSSPTSTVLSRRSSRPRPRPRCSRGPRRAGPARAGLAHGGRGERPTGRVPAGCARHRRAGLRRRLRPRSGSSTARWSSTTASGLGGRDRRVPPTRPTRHCPGCWSSARGSVAVTVHWRTAPGRGARGAGVGRRGGPRAGLEALPGRMAVELRPPVPSTRAPPSPTSPRAHVAGFAGDDAGDLAAFAALDRLEHDGRPRATACASAWRRRGATGGGRRGRRRRRRPGRPGRRCSTALADTISARLAEQVVEPALRRRARRRARTSRVRARAFVVGHGERGVQRVRALLDVVRVHRERRRRRSSSYAPAPARGTHHAVAAVEQRPLLGDEVQAVLQRVHQEHVERAKPGDGLRA